MSLLEKAEIVLISYPGSPEAEAIKKNLYSLSNHFPSNSILDPGMIRKGKDFSIVGEAGSNLRDKNTNPKVMMNISDSMTRRLDTLKVNRLVQEIMNGVMTSTLATLPVHQNEKVEI